MSSSEKFCLRWNDFESNISVAFRELREDKDFFDVTLACDDEQIQAHKVILSACSPFFRTILRRNPHQHPLLYLRGVKHTDLQSVLNFMYHGEVNVAQEELNSFLAVAEDLKVKGLTQNSTSSKRPKSPTPRKPSPRPLERDPTPAPKRPRYPPSNPGINSYSQDDDEIQEVIPVKTEPRDTSVIPPPPPPSYTNTTPSSSTLPPPSQALEVQAGSLTHYDGGEGYEDYGGYEDETGYEGAMVDHSMTGAEGNKGPLIQSLQELDRMISEQMDKVVSETGGKVWECLTCGKTSSGKNDIARHVESTHVVFPGIACHLCGKISKTRNALRNHIYSVHNVKF